MDENIIFDATDPEGRNIVLYDHVWDHIRKGHPEIIIKIQKIKSTIQKPCCITQDTSGKTLCYTDIIVLPPYFNVYTKMDDDYSKGRVVTAFLERDMPKGEVIWVDQG